MSLVLSPTDLPLKAAICLGGEPRGQESRTDLEHSNANKMATAGSWIIPSYHPEEESQGE